MYVTMCDAHAHARIYTINMNLSGTDRSYDIIARDTHILMNNARVNGAQQDRTGSFYLDKNI